MVMHKDTGFLLRPLGRIPNAAYEAFDYFMNTRKSYDLLGEALVYFNRQLKRNRVTPTQEFNGYQGYGKNFNKRWGRKLREAAHAALKDHAECFPEEHPDWIGKFGLMAVSSTYIMRLTLKYADRWSCQE
jgi:hypothetical protein